MNGAAATAPTARLPRSGERASQLRRRMLELFPALFFVAFLAATVALFVAGPWQWPLEDPSRVTSYLVVALALLLAASLATARSVAAARGRFPERLRVPLATAVVVANLAVLPLTLWASTGRWFPDLWGAVASPGEVYEASWRLRESGASWVFYLRILLGPLLALLLPVVLVERRHLPRPVVLGGAAAIVGELLLSLSTGTNRYFANLCLLLPWLLAAGHLSGRSPFRSRAAMARLGVALLVAWVAFAWFFQRTMETRRSTPAKSLELDLGSRVSMPAASGGREPARPAASTGPRLVLADARHPLLAVTPRSMRTGIAGITSYLTQGYFALALALEEPFVPMWGAGHSMFLSRQVERLPGLRGFSARSYPVRIEPRGWDAYGRWSSVFTWWASDVGFAGALVVFALVGSGLTASWRDLLVGTGNPFAAGAFAQLALFLAYAPANNQCLQSGEMLTGFWAMVVGWLVFRRPPQPP